MGSSTATSAPPPSPETLPLLKTFSVYQVVTLYRIPRKRRHVAAPLTVVGPWGSSTHPWLMHFSISGPRARQPRPTLAFDSGYQRTRALCEQVGSARRLGAERCEICAARPTSRLACCWPSPRAPALGWSQPICPPLWGLAPDPPVSRQPGAPGEDKEEP